MVPTEPGKRFDAYLFVVTPPCLRARNGCAAESWGVKNLGGPPAFLPEGGRPHESRLGRVLRESTATIDPFDVDKFLQVNFEAPEIQADLTRHCLPLVRVFLYCPPCLCAVTTAVAVCVEQTDRVAQFLVRVDHRLRCSCALEGERLVERVRTLCDTMSDVETGFHWARPGDGRVGWMRYLDRDWIDRLLYEAEPEPRPDGEVEVGAGNALHGNAEVRAVFTRAGRRFGCADKAVVLGDIANIGWIMNAPPFRSSGRPIQPGQIFVMNTDPAARDGNRWKPRELVGTYTTRDARRRRLANSPRIQAAVPAKRGRETDSESNISDVE